MVAKVARRRKAGSENLPRGLYRDRGSWRYKDPSTGKFHSLQVDSEEEAIQVANELNGIRHKPGSLFSTPVWQVIEEYKAWLEGQGNAPKTLNEKHIKLRRYRREFGDKPIRVMGKHELVTWLNNNIKSHDSYRQHRILLKSLFEFALSQGWVDENPMDRTIVKPRKQVKQRRRLALEEFRLLYNHAEPWLQIAMELSLLTGLRRENICKAQFSDFEGGELRIVTVKGGKHVAFSGLADLVQRAMKLPPACPFIVSKSFREGDYHRQNKDHRNQVLPDYMTRAFSELVKKHLEGDNLPTFHEIRSLTSDLYRKAGWDQADIQKLLTHDDLAMTEHYQDGHGVVWEKVTVGLEWK